MSAADARGDFLEPHIRPERVEGGLDVDPGERAFPLLVRTFERVEGTVELTSADVELRAQRVRYRHVAVVAAIEPGAVVAGQPLRAVDPVETLQRRVGGAADAQRLAVR